MEEKYQQEVYLILGDLKKVVCELSEISSGVRRDFEGIGNDMCANRLKKLEEHYKSVVRQVEKMDMSAVSDEFKEQQRSEARKNNEIQSRQDRKWQEEQKKRIEVERVAEKQRQEESRRREEQHQKAHNEQAQQPTHKKSVSRKGNDSNFGKNILEGLFSWLSR